jgi:DNA polymerase-3 subunit epsilon
MTTDKNVERQKKIDNLIANLTSTPAGLDQLRSSLGNSGLGMMTIITKDAFPAVDDPVRLAMAKKGILLDTETTGLDTKEDEVIELAMVEFFYDEQGIIALGDVYDEFNEPIKKEISEEIVALTGITNEMVKGKRIDPAEVKKIISESSLVLAHHASFDRKMVETNFPDCGFDKIDWHCSVNEIEWIMRGKNGKSLEVLATSEGYVYGSHRADADCLATAFVLMSEDTNGKSAFAELLENGNRDTIFLIAESAPFDAKDKLKDRGYRWAADGSEAYGIKAWYKEIPSDEESMAAEAKFMKDEIYRGDKSLPSYRVQASSRYTDRKPGLKELFHTKEIRTLMDASQQLDLETSDPGM